MVTINQRIKELRKLLGITQKELGTQLGLTSTGICDIESGKVKTVTESNIKLICKTFNVNEAWLRAGEGEPFNNKYEYREDLSDLQKDILTKLEKLDSGDKQAMITIIDSLYVKAVK